jgi:hypothetical protein
MVVSAMQMCAARSTSVTASSRCEPALLLRLTSAALGIGLVTGPVDAQRVSLVIACGVAAG